MLTHWDLGGGRGYGSEALEGTGFEPLEPGGVQVGTFKTLGVRVGGLQGYGSRAFGTLGVRDMSLLGPWKCMF